MRDLVLLFAIGVLLQFHLLGAHVFKLAVVAAVAHQLARVDMQRDVGHGIQKLAVMADHHHGAFVTLQPGFQPYQRVQVQVVGWLVEQQQIRWAHQRARQLQAHAPAAGEAVDRVLELGGFEAQAQDQSLRPRRGVVLARVVQRHISVAHAVAIVGGFGGCHFGTRVEQHRVALHHKVRGALVGLGHVLRHLAHTPLRGDVVLARVFVQATIKQGKQRGFARSVASDQTDFFAGIDGHGRAIEQDLGAAAQGHIFQSNHVSGVGPCKEPDKEASAERWMSTTWSSPALVESHRQGRVGKAASK